MNWMLSNDSLSQEKHQFRAKSWKSRRICIQRWMLHRYTQSLVWRHREFRLQANHSNRTIIRISIKWKDLIGCINYQACFNRHLVLLEYFKILVCFVFTYAFFYLYRIQRLIFHINKIHLFLISVSIVKQRMFYSFSFVTDTFYYLTDNICFKKRTSDGFLVPSPAI